MTMIAGVGGGLVVVLILLLIVLACVFFKYKKSNAKPRRNEMQMQYPPAVLENIHAHNPAEVFYYHDQMHQM